MIGRCRREWRGALFDWLNAALVLAEDGDPAYPALLGTGGNDGRLDFTNNFMQRLAEVFRCDDPANGPQPGTEALLQAALFDERQSGLASVAIGQFDPGGAGGANSSTGFSGGSLVNPWNFILMLEGAVAFASGVVRRMSNEALPQAAAPFAVYPSPSGYASGVEGEKSRGEQWMPLWDHPLRFTELKTLIAEGRCQLGDRPAKRPLDMARAVARLGVARGISAFERFGYIERNGQANLATPLGRWRVPESPVPYQELLDEVEGWVDRLRKKSGLKGAPASIGRAARQCENAMMNCCREGSSPDRWRELLICLGEAEAALARSPGFTASQGLQPLGAFGRLNPTWLVAAGADSAELRLALALAAAHGIRASGRADSATIRWDASDPVRSHFLPLEKAASAESRWPPSRFAVVGDRLASDPTVVCKTGDLQRDAIGLIHRRMVEAHRSLDDFFPFAPVPGAQASLSDLLAFVSGQVNDVEILALARPLMALDWNAFIKRRREIRSRLAYPWLRNEREAADSLGVYGLLRLCHYWKPVPVPRPDADSVETESLEEDAAATDSPAAKAAPSIERAVRLSPSIFSSLSHGNLSTAVRLSVQRLKASGLRPHLQRAVGDRQFALRLAASLAFPVGDAAALMLAERLVRPHLRQEDTQTPVAAAAVDSQQDQ